MAVGRIVATAGGDIAVEWEGLVGLDSLYSTGDLAAIGSVGDIVGSEAAVVDKHGTAAAGEQDCTVVMLNLTLASFLAASRSKMFYFVMVRMLTVNLSAGKFVSRRCHLANSSTIARSFLWEQISRAN